MGIEPPLLVELLGQPGAGKTTLGHAAAVGSDFRSTADLGAAWRRLPAIRKAMFLASSAFDGVCLTHAMRLVIGAPLLRGDSLGRLARLLVKSHWIRSQRGQLLLEEGFLQDLWSIFYSAGRMDPDPRLLAPLVRCLYRGVDAQIVFLQVDTQTTLDRIRGRTQGKSRLDRLAEADLRKRLAETSQLPLRIAAAARLAGLTVETIDASQPVEISVSQLRSIMPSLAATVVRPEEGGG